MDYEQLIKTVGRYNKLENALGSGCRLQIITTPGKTTHISVVHKHMGALSAGMFFSFSDTRSLASGRGDNIEKAVDSLTKSQEWLSVETYYDDRISSMREQLSDVREILEASNEASDAAE